MIVQVSSLVAIALLVLITSLTGKPNPSESGMIGDIRTVISAEP
jgi:hypothetical protein